MRDEGDDLGRGGGRQAGARSAGIDVCLLAGLYVVAVLIAGPRGDFALNDDWSWAYAARALVAEHVWRPTGFTSMPLVTHAAWGGLFCAVAGDCSYEILRWSTIVAGLIATLLAYAIGRELSLGRAASLALAATLASNPLFFSQSLTFMTDVTFVALAAGAMLFFRRVLRTDRGSDLALAAAFAVAATLCRQIALFAPLAFALASVFKDGLRARTLVRAAWPLAVCVAAYVLFNVWMGHIGATPALYGAQTDELKTALSTPAKLARNISDNTITAALYVGLFSLPAMLFAPVRPRDEWPWSRPVATAASLLFAAVAAGLCLVHYGAMPITGNILLTGGIGPHTMKDPVPVPAGAAGQAIEAAWILATALAVAGAGLLVFRIIRSGLGALRTGWAAGSSETATDVYFLLAAASYVALFLMVETFYDRYLLPLFLIAPLIGAASSGPAGRLRGAAACALLLVSVPVTILWEHDYMSWNRARWAVLERAEARGLTQADVDGGFEYNGPLCYDPHPRCELGPKSAAPAYPYAVTFRPIAGYRIVDRVPYDTWLPPGRSAMLLIEDARRPAVAPKPGLRP